MKDELGGKIITKLVGLRAKSNSYLLDDISEDKKAKGTKNCAIRRKPKIENYETCLEATQLDNEINYLEKNQISVVSLKKDHIELIKKNNKLNLETQQRFESENNNDLIRFF